MSLSTLGWPSIFFQSLGELEEWESNIEAAKETHNESDGSTRTGASSLVGLPPQAYEGTWLFSPAGGYSPCDQEDASVEHLSTIDRFAKLKDIAPLTVPTPTLDKPTEGGPKRPLEYTTGQWAGHYVRAEINDVQRRRTFSHACQHDFDGKGSDRYSVTMQEELFGKPDPRGDFGRSKVDWISVLISYPGDNYFSWAAYRLVSSEKTCALAAVNSEGKRFCKAYPAPGKGLDGIIDPAGFPTLQAPWQIPAQPPSADSASTD